MNNRDATFTEAAGLLGLDCIEDGRSFALSDIDGDGRLEIILKNRTAPQLRAFHNELSPIGGAIMFCSEGTRAIATQSGRSSRWSRRRGGNRRHCEPGPVSCPRTRSCCTLAWEKPRVRYERLSNGRTGRSRFSILFPQDIALRFRKDWRASTRHPSARSARSAGRSEAGSRRTSSDKCDVVAGADHASGLFASGPE